MTDRPEDPPPTPTGRWGAMGERMYDVALLLLPRALRERAGGAMAATFRERQRAHLRRAGRRGLPALWLAELGGLLATAFRARLSGSSPTGSPPPAPGPIPVTPGRRSLSIDPIRQDVRFALRTFGRRPLALGLATVTFALGLGTSTAMVSVVDTLLVRGLPYPEPEELVAVHPTIPRWREDPAFAERWRRGRFSPVEFMELEEEEASFEALGAFALQPLTLTGDELPPEVIPGFTVTPGLLGVLRVQPVLGRGFTGDDLSRDPLPVLISHGLWTRRFGADPDAVGDVLRSGERTFPILGVLPAGFRMPTGEADYLSPLDVSQNPNRNLHNVDALGRLADGVTLGRAEEEAGAILLRNVREPDHVQHTAFVAPLQDELAREARMPALILMGASFLLLAVACGSVAAILLGVGIDREGELGVRRALGAARGHVVAQLLTEGLVLAALGGLLGLGVAALALDLFLGLAPDGFPGLEGVGLDGRALLVALGLSTGAALVAALVPALSLSAIDPGDALRSARTAAPRAGRLQTAVVVGELALATVLLAGAGLLGRTLLNLNATDPGFDTEEVVAVSPSVHLLLDRFMAEDRGSAFARLRLYTERVVESLEGLPEVERAAAATPLPLGPVRANNRVTRADRPVPEDDQPVAQRRAVTSGFFETLGIELVEGRGFTEADARARDSVVVVSEGLARALWPGEGAVGRSLRLWAGDYRVVGVADNLRDETLRSSSELAFYVPTQVIGSIPTDFVVRTSVDPSSVVPALRERLWSIEPDVPILSIRTLEELRRETVSEERYRARLMLVFAVLATLFALTGVYGVTARSVARRRREMGIRMALGARSSGIHRMVLIRSLRNGLIGVALGTLLAVVLGRTLEGFLFAVEPGDLSTMGVVAASVLGAVVAATVAPALGATRVDPVETLRAE